MLHYQTVTPDLLTVLKFLMSREEIKHFRLVGGTSLALQIGHRRSIDIDMFTDQPFEIRDLQYVLLEQYPDMEVRWQGQNGFTCSVRGIKIDFFNWRSRFITDPVSEDGLRLLSKEEVSAMKLEAVTSRKEKKDFIDVACLLRHFAIEVQLQFFAQKYPFISPQFVLESLMAVDQADNSLEPQMLIDYSWPQVRNDISDAVKKFVEDATNKARNLQQDRLTKAKELLDRKKGRSKK